MRKFLIALLGTVVVGNAAYADEEVHWSYSGDEGPAHWGKLSAAFGQCGDGKNQSPINLTKALDVELEEVIFSYQDTSLNMHHNGHTIAVDYPTGSHLRVGENRYDFGHVHFHAPSEHQIEGQSYPLEAHFVHKDAQGNYAVVGVMFAEGEVNPLLEKIGHHLPSEKGQKNAPEAVTINVAGLLPEDKDYYRYNGSLTTPPCSEGLRWIVLKQPLTASAEQIKQFKAAMHHDNNRPLQPINARFVLE
jgi:carbonic anhydrase